MAKATNMPATTTARQVGAHSSPLGDVGGSRWGGRDAGRLPESDTLAEAGAAPVSTPRATGCRRAAADRARSRRRRRNDGVHDGARTAEGLPPGLMRRCTTATYGRLAV